MTDSFPEKLEFCYWGNPILRKTAIPVQEPESDETTDFIAKMREKLFEHDGLGLAANQVGCDRKICLVAFPKENDFSDIRALINPEIIEKSEKTHIAEEGCLSFPKIYRDIERPVSIKVSAFIQGKGEVVFEANDLLARIICHEVDHLNGVVFIDHLSQMKRSLLKKQLRQIAEKYSKK